MHTAGIITIKEQRGESGVEMNRSVMMMDP